GVTSSYDIATSTITISGTPTVTGVFNYTISLVGGCGSVISNGTITVSPDATINLTSAIGSDNQSVCPNTPITNITYEVTNFSGVTDAIVSGLPPGVTGVYNPTTHIITISGNPTSSGTFNYTVS